MNETRATEQHESLPQILQCRRSLNETLLLMKHSRPKQGRGGGNQNYSEIGPETLRLQTKNHECRFQITRLSLIT